MRGVEDRGVVFGEGVLQGEIEPCFGREFELGDWMHRIEGWREDAGLGMRIMYIGRKQENGNFVRATMRFKVAIRGDQG